MGRGEHARRAEHLHAACREMAREPMRGKDAGELQARRTSETPIAPCVSPESAPPKATTGARHAKYKKEMAARDFDLPFELTPSTQSEV